MLVKGPKAGLDVKGKGNGMFVSMFAARTRLEEAAAWNVTGIGLGVGCKQPGIGWQGHGPG